MSPTAPSATPSRLPHHHRGLPSPRNTLVVLLALLCVAATIPLGSIARWATASVNIACLLLAGAAWLFVHGRRPRLPPAVGFCATGILLWSLVQLIPLPPALFACLQPVSREGLAHALGDMPRLALAANPFDAISTLTQWLAYAALAFTARRVLHSRTQSQRFASLLIAAGVGQVLWGLVARADARICGTFSSGNALGGFLVLTLLPTLGLLLASTRGGRTAPRLRLSTIGLFTATLVQLAGLLLTSSRGALLAGALATALLLTWRMAIARRTGGKGPGLLLPTGLLALLALVGAGGSFALVLYRLKAMLTATDDALGVRWQIWTAAWRLFCTHPLGVGPGGFRDIFLPFQPAGFGDYRAYLAHNDWLQLLCELGLPGFILLVALVVLLGRQLAPLLQPRSVRASTWFWRSVVLALGATLLHALVDFNLTARPGVAITWFALLGAALAASDRRGTTAPAVPAPSPATPWLRWIAVALALMLITREWRCARASRLSENGFVATGGEPDPTAWLNPAPIDPATGVAWLRRAVSLTPRDGQAHYLLALGLRNRFETHRHALLAETQAHDAAIAVPDALRAVQLATRAEEVALLDRELIPILRTSAHQCPWDADARAFLGHAQLASGILHRDPETTLAGLATLDHAAWLAGNDLTVLETLCRGLGDALSWAPPPAVASACRERLWRWGRQALGHRGARPQAIFSAWQSAGFSAERALDWTSLPDSVRKELYQIVDAEGAGTLALKTLDALGASALPDAATRASRATFVLRERAKWQLRLARWEDYRAGAPQRAAAGHDARAREWQPLVDAQVSPTMLRLAMKNLARQRGLDPAHQLQLCRLEYAHGSLDDASRMLAELSFAPDSVIHPLLRPLAETARAAPANEIARRLAEARLASFEKSPADACTAWSAVVADPRLPLRYKLPARAQHAAALLAAGDRSAARTALADLAAQSPRCRTVLETIIHEFGPAFPVLVDETPRRALDLLADISPPVGIGAAYLGGALVLDGIDLERPALGSATQPVRAHLYWTFNGSTPSDLAIEVHLLKHPRNESAYGAQIQFSQAAPLAFGAGRPNLGETVVTMFTLPALSVQDARLSIKVTTSQAKLAAPTEEGLLTLELDHCDRFVRGPLSAAVSNRPPECVLANIDPDSGINLASLGPESFLLRSGPDNTTRISAATERGLRLGERALEHTRTGPRQLLPDLHFCLPPDVVPLLGPLWYIEAPAFNLRALYGPAIPGTTNTRRAAWESEWALTPSESKPQRDFSHNLLRIFNPARDFPTHPEWFPMHGGTRQCPTNSDWQPCLSASGLVERACEAAREHLSSHPESPIFSLGINDSANWCECDACAALLPPGMRALPAAERWWSNPYWRFVNAVADGVRHEFPAARIGAIAYSAVLHPPLFALRDNVVVYVCLESASHVDPAIRDQDRDLLLDWTTHARHLGRYDYAGLATWCFPRYCATELQTGLQEACRLGIRDFFMEDYRLPEIDGPLPWLAAQWLWNPWRDRKSLEADFCARAFGSASPPMQRYVTELQSAWDRPATGAWLEGFLDINAQARRYTPADLDRLDALLDQARRAAGNDATILARIDAIAAPLALTRALLTHAPDIDALLKRESTNAWARVARETARWPEALARWQRADLPK